MFEKNLWKSDILSKDAGHRHFFASKNQLPGFYISGTLVENGLILLCADYSNILPAMYITFCIDIPALGAPLVLKSMYALASPSILVAVNINL